jgi:thioredoxin-like negative regulator of GroEL
MLKMVLSLLLLLGAERVAWAQFLPPLPRPRRPQPPPPPPPSGQDDQTLHWLATLEEAVGRGRPILVYVHRDDQDRFPQPFFHARIHALCREGFSLVDLTIDQTPAELKVSTIPAYLGLDPHGNVLERFSGAPSPEQLYSWLGRIQELSRQAAAQMEARLAQAKKNVRLLMELAGSDRKGYPEIAAARRQLSALIDEQLARAEELLGRPESEKQGLALLAGLPRTFKEFAPAARIEILLASHAARKGELPGALAGLSRVLEDPKTPEPDRALALQVRNRLEEQGFERIRKALQLGAEGRFDPVVPELRAVVGAYGALRPAKIASRALDDLEEK